MVTVWSGEIVVADGDRERSTRLAEAEVEVRIGLLTRLKPMTKPTIKTRRATMGRRNFLRFMFRNWQLI
ncbi:MAG: hypothetical protein UX42_C0007G0002 [Microgenomates group bacterium GW2011_GWC1_46_20]|nr:MAG: hypothetical protein UX42_C0007G0002 [Microgenomates group bacterium GW2011_GWC1_46_20]